MAESEEQGFCPPAELREHLRADTPTAPAQPTWSPMLAGLVLDEFGDTVRLHFSTEPGFYAELKEAAIHQKERDAVRLILKTDPSVSVRFVLDWTYPTDTSDDFELDVRRHHHGPTHLKVGTDKRMMSA